MAKDAKGHGSDGRGGGSFDNINAQRKAQGFKPMDEKRRGVMDFLDYMHGEGPMPDVMKSVLGGGQPVGSNASAAATLASGPKSAPVGVHSGAAGRGDGSSGSGFFRKETPSTSGLPKSAGHSFLDPHDPRAKR